MYPGKDLAYPTAPQASKSAPQAPKMIFTCLPLGVNVVNGVADQLVSVVFGFQWKSTVRVRQTQEAGEIPKQPFVAPSRGILRVC